MLTVALLVGLYLLWQAWLVAAAPYPARYDYDEGVYAETAAAAASGQRLYATVFLSQPPLLIGLLARAFDVFGRSLASARGVLIGFSALWLADLAAIAAGGGRPRAAVWAVALAASAPAVVTASHTVQMEAASEALAALAVALGLLAAGGPAGNRGSARPDWPRWGAAGLAAGAAVMAKLSAATCLVPLAVIVAAGERATGRRQAALRTTLLAAGGLLAAAAATAWTGSPPAEMWRQAVAFHRAIAQVNAIDPGRAASLLLEFAAANWFLVALGLIGLAVRPIANRTIAAWLAADLAAVLLWRPVWPHHLVILATPLAVLGAVAVEAGAAAASRARMRTPIFKAAAGALIICWLAALTGAAVASAPENSAALHAAVMRTARTVPAGGWLVADDLIVPFLAGRDVPPGLCDTSEMRMRAGWLTAGALVAALGDSRVHGVVLWRGTFREMFPEFVGEAAKEFPRRWTAGGGREILTR